MFRTSGFDTVRFCIPGRSGVILRIVSGAEKHLIKAFRFGRLDQMLRTTVQGRGSAPQPKTEQNIEQILRYMIAKIVQ